MSKDLIFQMRTHQIGPCTIEEKDIIKTGLEKIGERIESHILWYIDSAVNIGFARGEFKEKWQSNANEKPTITAEEFIKTYLQP